MYILELNDQIFYIDTFIIFNKYEAFKKKTKYQNLVYYLCYYIFTN